MIIKRFVLSIIGALYLALSLMSPFILSMKTDIWNEAIKEDKLQFGGTHHLFLILIFLIIFITTYIFANSSKYLIRSLIERLDFSPEETKSDLDRISFLANFFTIVLYLSVFLQGTFVMGSRDIPFRLATIFAMLIMSLIINNYLDKKFRYQETGDIVAHFVLSVPILILNGIVFVAILLNVIFR